MFKCIIKDVVGAKGFWIREEGEAIKCKIYYKDKRIKNVKFPKNAFEYITTLGDAKSLRGDKTLMEEYFRINKTKYVLSEFLKG